jgi:hypothetical protein
VLDLNTPNREGSKALLDAVGSIVELFSPAECENYFKAAGYDPD